MSIQQLDERQRLLATQLITLSIDGLWGPRRVSLQRSVVTIGRDDENDLSLVDPTVSRFHVRLARQGVGWRVERLGDAKPMYVNGERREMAMLGHGDQLVIGGTVLRLEQPGVQAKSMRVRKADAREARGALASGLVPELLVATPILRFSAPLRADVVSVGRAPECTLVIPSPLISARQALLRRMPDGRYELRSEREATNRFTLRGRVVRRRTLRAGDTLTLGSRAQNQYVTLTYLASLAAGAATA
jgi:pSer/pThr/pTyr-binding forkhead associated (FHA) protein